MKSKAQEAIREHTKDPERWISGAVDKMKENGTVGTFTAAAKRHGEGVQAFAAQIHANPDKYSGAMRKKAAFARNVGK